MDADGFVEAIQRARDVQERVLRDTRGERVAEFLCRSLTITPLASPGEALADPVLDLCSRYDVHAFEIGTIRLGEHGIFKCLERETLTRQGVVLLGLEEGDLLVRDAASGIVKSVELSDPAWVYSVYAAGSGRLLEALAIVAAFVPPFSSESAKEYVQGEQARANLAAAAETATRCARVAGIAINGLNPYEDMLPTYTPYGE